MYLLTLYKRTKVTSSVTEKNRFMSCTDICKENLCADEHRSSAERQAILFYKKGTLPEAADEPIVDAMKRVP